MENDGKSSMEIDEVIYGDAPLLFSIAIGYIV